MKFIIFLLALVSCQTTTGLVVKSTPENATVSYFNKDTVSYEVLGQTPITIDTKNSKLSEARIKEMGVLRVEKPGYVGESILIPGDRLQTTEVVLNLKPNNAWIKKDSSSISKVAEDMARKLHTINRYSNSQNYSAALDLIKDLLATYPEASIFYDIKGSLHMLRNEKDLARQSFQRSVELKPDNMKTREMLEKLE